MLIDYEKKQKNLYDFIVKSVANNKISHAYLLETNGVSYAKDFAVDMAKIFLCDSLDTNEREKIEFLIESNNFPDLKIIDSKKMIKKEEMLKLQEDFSSKPLYGKYMFYIITDASKLNSSSANTILKFLEEPGEGIIAILLVNNTSLVLDTIVSRCQVLSFIPDISFYDDMKVKYDCDINKINDIISYYLRFEELKNEFFLDENMYMYHDDLSLFFEVGFYLYSDVLHLALNKKEEFCINNSDSLKAILNKNEMYDIIKKINIISNFSENCVYNVNKDLFIDAFIIAMLGVDKDD